MLCRVLYGGSVWWYHRFVCYVVYCMEVLFGGIKGLYVMACIVYYGMYCMEVLFGGIIGLYVIACIVWRSCLVIQ